MPKQDFNINTGFAAAGDVYGLAFTNSQRFTYKAEAEMGAYALAVVKGATSDSCKVGNSEGEILGITMRQNVLESRTRPGDGTIVIPKGHPLAVMLEGPINVVAKTAVAGEDVYINDTTGEIGGSAGAGYTKATNVKAIKYPVAAGDVFPVMVIMAAPK